MSEVTAAPPTHTDSGTPPASATPLRRARRAGYAVLGLQLAGFLGWSTLLYRRFALTPDFAIGHQAWFLTAHGHLHPYSTLQGFPFWRDHSEFLMWPLALLYWAWPHGVTLLWVQDVAVVAAEAVAFTWLCEIAERHRSGRDAAFLAGAGLLLLAANPWMWWAVSWDFHIQTVAALFAVLLARDLANGRCRAWAWVAPLLACGDVAGTYLAGIGLGGVLASRRSRRRAAVMVCLGAGATLLITLFHGNLGSGLQSYAHLAAARPHGQLSPVELAKGIMMHPIRVLRALWVKRVDVLANLAPAGLVGIIYPPVLPLVLVVLLADTLKPGLAFSEPLFQSLPVYVFLPVGTVAVLVWLLRRHRRAALLLAGLVASQALGWAAVWSPRTPGQWLRVSGAAAATLADIEARIPASAEVIASQGVVGRFSGRTDVRPLSGPGTVPVDGGDTWFVIAPLVGIELQSTASATALIGDLAGPLHASLVTHANGVWAFSWRPPPGVHTVVVPGESAPLLAWAAPLAPGGAGRLVMTGPARTWHLTSSGGKGYVADGLAWQAPPGRYQASVTLSATGPVNVEVWNDTGDALLARRSIPARNGVETVALPVDATTVYHASLYSGWGPFRADFVPRPPGQRLEVRVWSPGGETVNVYRAGLVGADGNAASRQGWLASEGD